MDAVYTEAKALLKSGFRYWFNDDEIAELYRESEDFQVQTAEMELPLRCFEKPTEDNPLCIYMTTTEMYVVKQKCTTANVVIYSDISLFIIKNLFCCQCANILFIDNYN